VTKKGETFFKEMWRLTLLPLSLSLSLYLSLSLSLSLSHTHTLSHVNHKPLYFGGEQCDRKVFLKIFRNYRTNWAPLKIVTHLTGIKVRNKSKVPENMPTYTWGIFSQISKVLANLGTLASIYRQILLSSKESHLWSLTRVIVRKVFPRPLALYVLPFRSNQKWE
jgi:hypothetical protein